MDRIIFIGSILLLSVNGFPDGMSALREFGSFPVNILFSILFFVRVFKLVKFIRILPKYFIYTSIILLILISTNIINIIDSDIKLFGNRSPLQQWLLQYLMILWFFISIIIWVYLFRSLKIFISDSGYKLLINVLIVSCIINVVFFIDDFIFSFYFKDQHYFETIISFFRGDNYTFRPSGLCTEPSYYGSWAMFVWPLLYYQKETNGIHKNIRYCSKVVAILVIVTAILSFSRLFINILLIQFIVIFIIYFNNIKNIFKRLFIIISIALSLFIISNISQISIIENIYSTLDIEKSGSSRTRIGTTIASINVFFAYPIYGIGIGQFSGYFDKYVPSNYLDYDNPGSELLGYIYQEKESRINTFNLFTRIAAECGIFVLLLFSYLFYKPFSEIIGINISKSWSSSFYKGLLLTFIGGIMYWMNQDLFSYQIGIMALAIGLSLKSD